LDLVGVVNVGDIKDLKGDVSDIVTITSREGVCLTTVVGLG
jgi:hypothetical protein